MNWTKPHKGVINDWYEEHLPDRLKVTATELYGPNLGYFIKGRPTGHPDFIDWVYTSLVVERTEYAIETLNSRYTLGKEKLPCVEDS